MATYILIIENDLVIQKQAGILLEKEGFEVRYASDVESALTILVKTPPTLILMSLTLLKMTGFTLTRILKNDTHTNNIICVGLIDFIKNDFQDKIIDSGLDGYISMPIDETTFAKVIKSYLKKQYNNTNEHGNINKS